MHCPIIVLVVMVSLPVITGSFIEPSVDESERRMKDGMKDMVDAFVGNFLHNELSQDFKVSDLLSMYVSSIKHMKAYVNEIDYLHKQCIKGQEKIQRICDWAQEISKVKANSSDLLQYSHSMKTKAEKGRIELKEIEKQKAIITESNVNIENAMNYLNKNHGFALQDIINPLFLSKDSFFNSITRLTTKFAYFGYHTYSVLTTAHNACSESERALQVAHIASNNIKECLEESKTIQKYLQSIEAKHLARRLIKDQSGVIISDASSCLSFLQNAVFMTFLAAFLIANKLVW